MCGERMARNPSQAPLLGVAPRASYLAATRQLDPLFASLAPLRNSRATGWPGNSRAEPT